MFGNDLFLQHCCLAEDSSFVDVMTLNLFKMLLKLLLLLTLAVFELLLVKLVDAEHSAFSNSLVLWMRPKAIFCFALLGVCILWPLFYFQDVMRIRNIRQVHNRS